MEDPFTYHKNCTADRSVFRCENGQYQHFRGEFREGAFILLTRISWISQVNFEV